MRGHSACVFVWLAFAVTSSPVPGQATKHAADTKSDTDNRSSSTQVVAPSSPVVNSGKTKIEQQSSHAVTSTDKPSAVRITELPPLPLGKDWMDRVGWIASLILVAVGVRGVFLANRTLKGIERQASVMERQADHMRDGLSLTQDELALTRQSADAATQSASAAMQSANATAAQIELMKRQADLLEQEIEDTRKANVDNAEIASRTLTSLETQSRLMERQADLMQASMTQWVSVSRWNSSLIRAVGPSPQPKSLLVEFEIRNESNFPLTMAVYFRFFGNLPNATGFGTAPGGVPLFPRKPFKCSVRLSITEQQAEDFLGSSLRISVHGEIIHVGVARNPSPLMEHCLSAK
jgi:hypothetical protein